MFLIRDIINETTIQEHHLLEKFMIVITNISQNNTNELSDIFHILWKNGLINSNVLLFDESQSWSLYTFIIYRNTDCSIWNIIKLMSSSPFNLTQMPLSLEELYPEKLGNFNRCILYIAVSTTKPFIFSNNSSLASQYSGIENDIITYISKSLNFSTVFKRTSDGTNHGIVFPNQTITGNMKMVHRKI